MTFLKRSRVVVMMILLSISLTACFPPPSMETGGDGCVQYTDMNIFSTLIMSGVIDPVLDILYGENTETISDYVWALQDVVEPGGAFEGRDGGVMRRMYEGMIGTPENPTAFSTGVRLALVLYIILFGIYFTLGMVQMTQQEFLIRIVKFGLVATLFLPESWVIFDEVLFSVLVQGTFELINIMSSAFTGAESNNLEFLDATLGKIFMPETWIKLLALLFMGPFGFIYLILAIWALIVFVIACIKGITIYIISLIAMALLIGMAPLFIAFLLFKQTTTYFNKWLSLALNAMLQPILVFTALAMFSRFFDTILSSFFGFSSCWKAILSIPIPGFGDVGLIYFWQPEGIDNAGDFFETLGNFAFAAMTGFLPQVLTLIIIADATDKVGVGYSVTLAKLLCNISGNIDFGSTAGAMWEGVKEAMPKDMKKSVEKMEKDIDDPSRVLFGSGGDDKAKRDEGKKEEQEDYENPLKESGEPDNADDDNSGSAHGSGGDDGDN